MSFFDAFTEERAELALKRTQKNIDDCWRKASRHPVEAALVIGSLVTLAVFAPAPVLSLLLISALALLCLNLFTPPSNGERMRSHLDSAFLS